MFLVYLFIPLLSFACRSSAWISPSNISTPSVRKNQFQNQLLASSSIALWAAADSSQDDDETPCDLPEDNVYLLNRIGGEPALEAAVEEFYARVVVDEKLMRYFEGVPMENLKGHQLNFLRMAFTEIPGDCDITDYLTTSHDRLWEMVCCVDHYVFLCVLYLDSIQFFFCIIGFG